MAFRARYFVSSGDVRALFVPVMIHDDAATIGVVHTSTSGKSKAHGGQVHLLLGENTPGLRRRLCGTGLSSIVSYRLARCSIMFLLTSVPGDRGAHRSASA